MMDSLEKLGKRILPPVVVDLLNWCRSRWRWGGRPEWEHVPDGWESKRAGATSNGWSAPAILETYEKKLPRFKSLVESTCPLGFSHESTMDAVTDLGCEHNHLVFAYSLALAAQNRSSVSLLDWGGGIGHYQILAERLLPETMIQYHCRDLPHLVEFGQRLFPDQHFYDSDNALTSKEFDLVLVSGALQYIEDWQDQLTRLADATGRYLLVARTPMVTGSPSYTFVQRAYKYGYNTEYIAWCIEREELIRTAEAAGLELFREFLCGEAPIIKGAPARCHYRSILFKAMDRTAT